MSVVLDNVLDNPVLLFEEFAHLLGLSVAEFQHKPRPICQAVSCSGENPKESQAIRPAVERRARVIIADFGFQRLYFSSRDVRWITDDQIELRRCGEAGKAVSFQELDAFRNTVPRGILARDHERVGRAIQSPNTRGVVLESNSNRDAGAARAEVKYTRACGMSGRAIG